MSSRQHLKVINNTSKYYEEYGRKLKLEWSGDTHEGESRESILEVGQSDTKKSKRTDDANFIVDIFREKNGEWINSGQFSEHVSGIGGSEETNELLIFPDSQDQAFLLLARTDNDPPIRRFKKEEW
ncbi:hypothetical protein [Bacillus toyonensis]|uniref:hypothetical protein n=1 Tax=Bacillus toyonensis TaxID=155322 RepID=UPI000B43755E|nr:hypothetical protein [Bacillus toyonensis]MED3202185.1 hypothetical protein [Bacillus toyonensis]OTX13839.1 hypothetical protein BK712_01320 [Bacillus thuringiensis serovar seoulensis]